MTSRPEILENNDEFKITHSVVPDGHESWDDPSLTIGKFVLTHKPTGATSDVYYDTDDNKNIYIRGMNSDTKRQGHMTRLMHHVYKKFPGEVNFGGTSHEGTFLAKKMESIYGRTYFDGEDY